MRRKYQGRFVFRILVFCGAIGLYVGCPESFEVLEPGQFLSRFSALHLIWVIWMGDMLLKLFPIPGTLALGAAKQLRAYFVPAPVPASKEQLRAFLKKNGQRALLVLILWTGVGIAAALLWRFGAFGRSELFLTAAFFYVCDLFCVVVWCPFKSWFLKNRCCTTCRIFNWDHLMMVAPLICVGSFYSWSLILAAAFVLLLWEYRVYRYPERFYEGTNEALKCKNCTDLLCGKRRKQQ